MESKDRPATDSRNDNAAPAKREELWRRLERLVEKSAGGGLPRLNDAEVEELAKLYRAASTHLALLSTFGASTRRRNYVNQLVSRAHGVIYGRPRKGKNVTVYLLSFLRFPETVRATLRYHLLAATILMVGGVYGYLGAAADPEWTLEFVGFGDPRTAYASREELRESLLAGRPEASTSPEGGEDRENREISSGKKAFFAAFLWKHNTTVALLCFFSGFLGGLPTALLVLFNGVMLGVYSHTFHSHGLAWEWWAWILPHGITELLAIVLLAGGGLFVGRKMLLPGDLARLDVLRQIRPDALHLLFFAFPMLLLAALIEAFVRQSGLSDPARYVFAAVSAIFWVLYLGFARLPVRLRQRVQERRTLSERAIPLPVDEDILRATRRRR